MLEIILARLLFPRAHSLDDVRAIIYSCGEVSEATHHDGRASWFYAWAAWLPW